MQSPRRQRGRMLRDDDLRDTVLLVLANKQDLPNAMTVAEVAEGLRLDNVWRRQWSIQSACAKTGAGVFEGLDWIEETVATSKATVLHH